jgi:hypothetical protein
MTRCSNNSLRDDPPFIHLAGSVSFAVAVEVLDLIRDHVREGAVTVETGLGASTAAFALAGADHTAICPDGRQIELFRDYCGARGIVLDTVRIVEDRSENALPRLDTRPIDLALIDGGHNFPTPFLDWYYLAVRLRTGGIVVVDDTHLWTGHVLKRFLRNQPGWEPLEADLGLRTAAFRMTAPYRHVDWNDQPFVVRRSRPTRLIHYLRWRLMPNFRRRRDRE